MAAAPVQWPLPAGITAVFCDRLGGCSAPPYQGFNLGLHVGDSASSVAANRQSLLAQLPPGTRIQWLQQVHGARVVRADAASVDGDPPEADAVISSAAGIACAVMVADCLPLLLCGARGDAVGAVHAGWRGLAAGVVEQAVAAMPCAAGELCAWLGPCIGPGAFEVGPEVLERFLEVAAPAQRAATEGCFKPSTRRAGHFLADLQQLALLRLHHCGVTRAHRDTRCTYSLPARFFSHRRDGVTGRMAALVLVNPHA